MPIIFQAENIYLGVAQAKLKTLLKALILPQVFRNCNHAQAIKKQNETSLLSNEVDNFASVDSKLIFRMILRT